MYQPFNLAGFEIRKAELKKIKRYVDSHTQVMYYRSTDWQHSWRVLWHLEEILPRTEIFPGFNIELSRRMAIIHDDLEIITGDVQLYRKEQMSDEELRQLKEKEKEAIDQLAKRFPFSIDGYPYRELLEMAHEKNCLEAQLVSYCDKFDGFGEALHEVYAGNSRFLRPTQGTMKDSGYIRRVNIFSEKYPELQQLLEQKHPLFNLPRIDFDPIAEQGKPHTPDSIIISAKYAPYDFWKGNIMKRGKKEWLLKQTEFES